MKKIEFGINDCAQVWLTTHGKVIWRNFMGEQHLAPSTLREPLWKIMLIFGSSFGVGAEPSFEGNRIQIEVPKGGSNIYLIEESREIIS